MTDLLHRRGIGSLVSFLKQRETGNKTANLTEQEMSLKTIDARTREEGREPGQCSWRSWVHKKVPVSFRESIRHAQCHKF